ncbi:MAG: helix-turn-helix domain-containing protein [Brevinematia bacterium]
METIGNYIRNLRLSKSISIEEVVRNTNIPRKYIEEIERENFSNFPGEVYIKGYIRSYVSFLGGDPEYAIKLYEKKQIEEREVPLDVLVGKNYSLLDKINFRKILPTLTVIILALILIWILFSVIFQKNYEVIVDNDSVKTILKTFSVGEEFYHKVGNKEILMKLIEVRNNGNNIIVNINNTISSFTLKSKSMMDFDLDGIIDLEVKYESFINGKPSMRISFYKSQERKSKEEIVFIEKLSIPINFEIISSNLVWISTTSDNSEEQQVYLKKDDSKIISVRSKLIIKTSNIEFISIKVGDKILPISGKGPSYISIDISEGIKGVSIKISYLE